MEYRGYTARKLAEAAEAFEKELRGRAHEDDFWQLKQAVHKFGKEMRENEKRGGE